ATATTVKTIAANRARFAQPTAAIADNNNAISSLHTSIHVEFCAGCLPFRRIPRGLAARRGQISHAAACEIRTRALAGPVALLHHFGRRKCLHSEALGTAGALQQSYLPATILSFPKTPRNPCTGTRSSACVRNRYAHLQERSHPAVLCLVGTSRV